MAKIANPQPAGPTDAKQIAAFEKHIGHKLPSAYREFLLTHNGGRPVPDAFMLTTDDREPEEDLVLCFFPLRDISLGEVDVEEMDELHTWPLHCAWDDLQNDLENLYEMELDPPLLPIGTDGSSNYLSLVLSGERAGAVVFLDHETAEDWPLAPSFSAFLDSLSPRKRKDYHKMFGTGD
ncbi:SMI1/KNR4 family protein [Anatilimnocola sp. NA78]|uniref:SMI1/KNR4 family protein n=1 Tax=Anatilimnocola sp. NA78 TaxID=3415683 RepID=UPI003CE47D64